MRQIQAEVAAILKSRSMIGANKPACEVTVEGFNNGSIDFDSLGNTLYSPLGTATSDTMYSSSCEISDGRVLVVWIDGDKIRQGYATNAELLFANNCISNKSDLFTGLSNAAAIICETDAGLFLLTTWEQQNSDKTAKVLLYKSAQGDGSDWVLYATIQSFSWSALSVNPNGNHRALTKIFKTGSRYILQCPLFLNDSSYLCTYFSIYDSTNLINWSKKFQFEYGVGSFGYHIGCSSTFVEIDSVTYVALWSWYGGQDMHLIKSTDGFSTNQSELWSIETDASPYNSVAPYSSCTLYYDVAQERFLIIGAQIISSLQKLFIWGCNKSIIGTPASYTLYASVILNSDQTNNGSFVEVFNNKNAAIWCEDFIIGIEVTETELPVKSIGINRNKNMAGSLSLSIDNKNGEWSPDNTAHQNVLFPNSEITVKQGYGAELVQTFKGLIDRIEMSTFPQELKLSVRDRLKLALDQTITNGTSNIITYIAQTVEAIFTDLASKAGLTAGTIEATGLTLAEKTFSWETYADCFSWLADLVGFEYGADEEGNIYFKKDAIPSATDWILTFTSGTAQAYAPIIEGSETLKTADGVTTYVKGTDYTIDYETGEITSITIPDGQTLMSYVFVAYTFREGEDIISLGYTIDDNDLYSKVVVYGKDANDTVISAYKDYVSKDYYKVLSQKIMKIDASDADTVEKCQAIADRAEMLMRSRVREVSFACIAVPWLQVGDLIQVVESSTTISEIYRVTDLSTTMDSNGYTMQIVCYHHSA